MKSRSLGWSLTRARLGRLCCRLHMNLGRVIGTVVATQKYEGLEGKIPRRAAARSRTADGGDPIVAVDTVRVGPGELVYFVNSREAALACDPWFCSPSTQRLWDCR